MTKSIDIDIGLKSGETFADFASREIARSRKFFAASCQEIELPPRLPKSISDSISSELRASLQNLWGASLETLRNLEEWRGHDAVVRFRSEEKENQLKDPSKASARRDGIQVEQILLQRRQAFIEKFADEYGQKYFDQQDEAVRKLLPAIQELATDEIRRENAALTAMGFRSETKPLPFRILSLLQAYTHVQNVRRHLAVLRSQWENRKSRLQCSFMSVDARLLEFLGISKPDLKAPQQA